MGLEWRIGQPQELRGRLDAPGFPQTAEPLAIVRRAERVVVKDRAAARGLDDAQEVVDPSIDRRRADL